VRESVAQSTKQVSVLRNSLPVWDMLMDSVVTWKNSFLFSNCSLQSICNLVAVSQVEDLAISMCLNIRFRFLIAVNGEDNTL